MRLLQIGDDGCAYVWYVLFQHPDPEIDFAVTVCATEDLCREHVAELDARGTEVIQFGEEILMMESNDPVYPGPS